MGQQRVSELQAAAATFAAAADYTYIFGKDPGTTMAKLSDMYRKLARIVHPDRHKGSVEATTVFQLLNKFRGDAVQALNEGRYGQPAVTVRTKRGVHEVRRKLGDGDIASLYQTVSKTDISSSINGFLKVAKSARDNDLVAAEAKALKALHSVDDKLTRHFRRRATVQTFQEDCLNLSQVRDTFAPDGLGPLHVVWVWRRLLMALGFAHDQGVVHGAVLPPHVMLLPKHHGVLLVDWCYSVPMTVSASGSKTPPVRAIVSQYRDWYPEEIIAKQSPNQATDIIMAARTTIYLAGGNPVTGVMPDQVPRRMRAFFKGCLVCKQRMRPDNAWKLLAEFDELLERLGEPYFPRKWVELA